MSKVVFQTQVDFYQAIAQSYQALRDNQQLRSQMESYLSVNPSSDQLPDVSGFIDFLVNFSQPSPTGISSNDRIYIDGCWDIMHSGHFNAIRQAKLLGKQLVVGVHTDQQILRNKGSPVMNTEERMAMVRACKWVDEVVGEAPYTPSIEWLDSINCQYIAHGDDIAINEVGADAYQEIKAAGRFKVIKRTQGISTTSIVGKLLLMTRESINSLDEPAITASTNFLTTTRRISEFSNQNSYKPRGKIVYVDGSFDLFHVGHIETFRKAKEMGDFLIVGIHDDKTVNQHKGANYPIMHLHERVLNVLANKYVDEVVIGAPWAVTEDLIKSLNISVVVRGSISKTEFEENCRSKQSQEYAEDIENPYELPQRMNIFAGVTSEREIETKLIIERIINNRLKYLNKFAKSSEKETRYYQEKTFIEEGQLRNQPNKFTQRKTIYRYIFYILIKHYLSFLIFGLQKNIISYYKSNCKLFQFLILINPIVQQMLRKRSRSRSPPKNSMALATMPDPDSYQMQEFLHGFSQFNAQKSTRIDSQVYIDNLSRSTDIQQFLELFIAAMRGSQLLLKPGDPITKYWRPEQSTFIFLEFRSVQQANNALTLSGATYKHRQIKVSRPKHYSGSQPIVASDMNVLFGNYASKNAAKKSLQDLANSKKVPARKIDPPSRILKLKNILVSSDFKTESEVEDIKQDIRDMCMQYGNVISLAIPKPSQKGNGNVYVEFLESQQAMKARSALSMKRFNKRWVEATYHPELMYGNNDFREFWELAALTEGQ